MYIKDDGYSGYNRQGEQIRQRGLFLLLVQPKGVKGCDSPIKAVVRMVSLRQCGHWMMGGARIYNQWIGVSGSYGGDGLTCDVPQAIYDRLPVTLPTALENEWNHGGGHNTSGSEGPNMRKWAIENLESLRQ